LCECGCGGLAPIATRTVKSRGHVKGQPIRFIHSHNVQNHNLSLEERFWLKVNKQGPAPSTEAVNAFPEIAGLLCWEWKASTRMGYGSLWVDADNVGAHRIAWFLAHGTWPKDCCLHKCDNRLCVRLE